MVRGGVGIYRIGRTIVLLELLEVLLLLLLEVLGWVLRAWSDCYRGRRLRLGLLVIVRVERT